MQQQFAERMLRVFRNFVVVSLHFRNCRKANLADPGLLVTVPILPALKILQHELGERRNGFRLALGRGPNQSANDALGRLAVLSLHARRRNTN